MPQIKPDIGARTDVIHLVNSFYDKVKADPLLSPVFAHVDWPHHLPTMYDFWSSMLLGDQTYRGNPLQKHFPLAIRPEHFNRWLKLFHATVDENFAGAKAEEVKMRSNSIATVFQYRMGLTS